MLHAGSLWKNQKLIGLSFLGSFFIFSVYVLPLFMNLTSGTSSGLPFFSLLSLSSPPSTDSSFPALSC